MLNTKVVHTMSEQIAEQLTKEILSGTLRQESPLREKELSERFGVSRGPVRAALQQLSRDGLVLTAPNVGARVAPHTSNEIRPLIAKMRQLIEIFALETAFDNITADTLARLKESLEEMRTACKNGDIHTLREHDRDFHGTLVELYGEERLLSIWLSLFTWMIFCYGRHSELVESYQEHHAILQALEKGQKDNAIQLLQRNIL